MQTWCQTQLKKLRGDDDLTLAYICMTLPANSEVADTIHQAIQGPGVNQFVTEFIRLVQSVDAVYLETACK